MNLERYLSFKEVFAVALLVLFSTEGSYAQESQLTQTQRATERSLKQKMPDLKISWNSKLKIPRYVRRIRSEPLTLEPQAIRSYFVDNFGSLYQIKSPDREIQEGPIETDRERFSFLSLYQKHENIPVYGISLRLRLDRENRLQSILGKWIPGIDVETTPKLNQSQAADSITRYLREKYTGTTPLPKELQLKPDLINLVIFNPVIYGEPVPTNYLAYHVIVRTQVFFVDARTGKVLYTYSNVQDARDRNTYNSNDCFSLPGTLIIDESGPVGGATPDAQTQNAHDFAGMAYDYYWDTHGRDSYDDAGSSVESVAHSGTPIDLISLLICCLFDLPCCGCIEENAAWIPSLNLVVYGDGGTLDDGRSFNSFTDASDVVAHELTHGVIQYSVADSGGNPVGLDYTGESGALNESYADLFAAMVDREDWLVGEDLVIAGYPAGALRNLADPTNGGSYDPADPEGSVKAGHQPDHMDNFVSGGDVHINSGIPNKVGYLIAEGGVHPHSGISVKGIGREATEKILYDALTNGLGQTATFLEARAATLDSVEGLFPGNEFNYVTVWNAFVACGICDAATAGDCDPRDYPTSTTWRSVFAFVFAKESDLTLLRQYRDEFLVKSDQGKRFTALFYQNSLETLKILLDNPEWLLEARELVESNRDSVLRVLNGDEGTIYNTDKIVSFLNKFALRSPIPLKVLANEVKEEILKSRNEGELFLGFRLR